MDEWLKGISEIMTQVDDLSLEERCQIKEYLLTSIEIKTKSLFQSAYKEVEKCPHCDGQKLIKWGSYRNQQRFMCNDCRKTFISTTGNIFHHLKNTEKFINYLILMFSEGFNTTVNLSKRVGVCQKTGFEWRHRLSISLKNEPSEFKGITEMDDLWFRYSQKGRRGLKYSKVRGGSSHKGDNNFQAKVLVTKARKGEPDISLLKIGRLSKSDIKRKLHGKFKEAAILVSDKHPSIASFAVTEGIEHESFLSKDHVKDKDFHVQSVNYLAGVLNDGVNHRLRGVSTKYLQNYATWLAVTEEYKGDTEKAEKIIISCMSNKVGWDMYSNIETLYKEFLLSHSRRTYRCPTKQNRKAENWNFENAKKGVFI